jgi:hypothetical protein
MRDPSSSQSRKFGQSRAAGLVRDGGGRRAQVVARAEQFVVRVAE